MREVVVTGIGMVTPFGTGKAASISALKKNSRFALQPVSAFKGTCLESQKVGFVPDLKTASRQLPRKFSRFMSKSALISCLAGKEAAEEADVQRRFPPDRIGIFAATGLTAANIEGAFDMVSASIDETGKFSEKQFAERGLGFMNPLNAFHILPNMPPCILSLLINAKGPNLIFNPWEGQAAAAMLEGLKAVQSGDVDCALVGSADTPDEPSTLLFLRQQKLLGDDAYASPAGAYLVLEPYHKAKEERRAIYTLIRSIHLKAEEETPYDPLSRKIGRVFAAAPPLLLAISCMGLNTHNKIIGTRGISITFDIQRIEQ